MDHDARAILRKIGTIVKVHGLKGELIIDPEVDIPELLTDQVLFYVDTPRGDMDPKRVENSYLVNKAGRFSFFVKFESVDDRSQAGRLLRHTLYVPLEQYDLMMEPADELSPDELVGYAVLDESGQMCGEVVDVANNPAHPILEIASENASYMIPLVDEYVESVDHDAAQIRCRNLQPLMEV